jgi:uncharacterized membrane protein
MLPETFTDLTVFLAQAVPGARGGNMFHPPDNVEANIEIVLRWIHILAGIVWIGHLYFFNLVNVNLMKALDGPTKGKVIPQLMPRALWWFRWGAAVTVVFGIIYYIQLLHREPDTWPNFFKWLIIVLVVYAVIFGLLRPVSGALNNGWILAAIVAALVIVFAIAVLLLTGNEPGLTRDGVSQYMSNRSLSIGIGGGLGVMMLLNVWGIIWPHQKRIISWTSDNAEKGTAIPAESAKLARRAFLASRMNTWLSIPMLFFMASASHYPLFGR